jgi:uncharacterized protein YbjT (DUF2867 family)
VTPAAWAALLDGVDAVVNCAGVLQDGVADSAQAVHVDAPRALFQACKDAGVRKVIQISAMGADREALSRFSETKRQGDLSLTERDLDWVILRPSVVLGRGAYGGSALLRGLASLPFVLRPAKAGRLQVVQLDDVVETVAFFLRPEAPARVDIELAGPEQLPFEEVIARYRSWLGWRRPRPITAPYLLMNIGYRLGDLAGALGWRAPIRTTARREMVRGAVGDPSEWMAITGIDPQSMETALLRHPATAPDRWFAGLFVLKPFVFGVLAIFWIGTGLISLGPGFRIGAGLMREGGAGALSEPSVVAGALADIAIGTAIAFRPTARLGLYAALLLSIFYLVAGTVILPRLWADPLGPMWKIWPILVLIIAALAILDDR